jgi:hypothetical protein
VASAVQRLTIEPTQKNRKSEKTYNKEIELVIKKLPIKKKQMASFINSTKYLKENSY